MAKKPVGSKRTRTASAETVASQAPVTANPVAPKSAAGAATPTTLPGLTHAQIAERAWAIWQDKGCQPGQDEQNWREAEAQLKAELRIA